MGGCGVVFFFCLLAGAEASQQGGPRGARRAGGGWVRGARAHIGPSAISVCLCVCVRVGFAPGGWYLAQVGVLRRGLRELAGLQLPGLMPRVSFPDDGGLRLTPLRRRAVRCNFLKYRRNPPRNRLGVRRNSRSLSRSLPALVL